MSIIQIQAESGAKQAEVNTGDIIVIELAENPTTGFRWQTAFYNQDDVHLIKDEFITGESSGVGGGGKRILQFSVNKKNTGSIKLENKQAWSEGVDKTFELKYS